MDVLKSETKWSCPRNYSYTAVIRIGNEARIEMVNE